MNDWLPPHQRHLLFTLAHIDAAIETLARVLYGYVLLGPIEFDYRIVDGRKEVLVRRISPVPQAVPRVAPDVLNQLRSSIEHAWYAEIEHLTRRPLVPAGAQAVKMPVAEDRKALAGWFNWNHFRTLTALHADGVLGGHIERLQPFTRPDQELHPLKVLAEYITFSSRRELAVAAVRLGTVVPEDRVPGLTRTGEHEEDRPLNAGDVLASVPAGVRVPMEIWPSVGIQRPHVGTWVVLMHELRELEGSAAGIS
jgi:hypothetical protein